MKRLLIAFLLTIASASFASKVGILALSSFRLESTGVGSSGKVVIEGQQNDKSQLVNLKVGAFGKDYVVPREKLAGLAELLVNGIRISYEAGYAELGGRTIYIELQMGFTSHTMQAMITVTENGKIEVGKISPTRRWTE